MKILFVIRTMHFGGGAERLMFDIYNELKKNKKHTIKLLILEKAEIYKKYNYPNADFFEKQLEGDSNIIYTKSSIKLHFIKNNKIDIEEYKNIVQDFKPNIIHSHLYLADLLSREFLYPKACYFTHVHDNIVQFQNLKFKFLLDKNKITNFFEKWRILIRYRRSNNYFLSISKDTYNYIENTINPPKGNNILFENAINFNHFYHTNSKSLLPSKSLNLVSIGSLVKKKNQLFLLEIATYLRKNNINFEINIIGEGSDRTLIEKKIIELKLEKSVFLRSIVDNVEDYLKNADIYLHPATYEPFGLVILEAMASGLPVVCLNGKGNVGLNVEGKTGFMIDPPDAEKFADKILYLINNSEEYSKISEYCVNFAKDYDIEIYCKKLVDIYQNAIDKKNGIK